MAHKYTITKTFGHDRGYTVCYRQMSSINNCRFLHGYALSFSIEIRANTLDDCGHVWDFGNFKELAVRLGLMFDHVTIVENDDPLLYRFQDIERKMGPCFQLRAVSYKISCENFAKEVYDIIEKEMLNLVIGVDVVSVTCAEHGSNSATYYGEHDVS